MAKSNHLPPSIVWSLWKMLKGTRGTTVTVPTADLQGKWVLISGSNNGIGREAAIRFAASGANLILACRQPPWHETHPDQVVEECKNAARENQHVIEVEWWECDMADLSSVEALGKRWNETGRPLDILANNAGLTPGAGKPVITRDGFEICHQVNFLSHTLLTFLLLPSLARASSPRIICTTSCLHYGGRFDLSNANNGVAAYPNNKLYFQIWLTELQLRLFRRPEYAHIVVHGVHPGYVKSGIWRPHGEGTKEAGKNWDPAHALLKGLLRWFGIDSQQGSLAIYNAATGEQFGLKNDAGEFRGGAGYFNRIWLDEPNPYTRDPGSRKEVWDFVLGEVDLGKRTGISPELKEGILL